MLFRSELLCTRTSCTLGTGLTSCGVGARDRTLVVEVEGEMALRREEREGLPRRELEGEGGDWTSSLSAKTEDVRAGRLMICSGVRPTCEGVAECEKMVEVVGVTRVGGVPEVEEVGKVDRGRERGMDLAWIE